MISPLLATFCTLTHCAYHVRSVTVWLPRDDSAMTPDCKFSSLPSASTDSTALLASISTSLWPRATVQSSLQPLLFRCALCLIVWSALAPAGAASAQTTVESRRATALVTGQRRASPRTDNPLGTRCVAARLPSFDVRLSAGNQLLYVEPEAVAYGRKRLLVLGGPVLVRNQSTVTPAAIKGRPAAGALIASDGRAALVPMPPGAQRLFAPRVLYEAGAGWHVLWIGATSNDTARFAYAGAVMYARFDGRSWSRPSRISSPRRFPGNPTLPSALVRTHQGFALALPGDPVTNAGAVILINEAGRWRETVVSVARGAVYAALEELRGQLVLAYSGSTADGDVGLSVTRSQDGGTTWSNAHVVVHGTVYMPRLQATDRDVAIVWIGAEETYNPRGIWIAFSHDVGQSWTAATLVPDGADATSAVSVRLSRGRSLLLHTSLKPRPSRDLVLIEDRNSTLLARDTLEIAPIAVQVAAASDDRIVALWSNADLIAGAQLPRQSLRAFRVSCRSG